ncbi:hypothetical protein K469DRAFT_209352 [Zopfia rhizophila CBS 207.26]|uniref:Uncharacterized protein n=1 Tax=Zopfia rhizophila CBS 207.26 TaxID=1314779 RepID=A0A6A6DV27_9PEZI|nr:hypothetical protein K469DRAFT_209352 [Zopfia rhizophila CBS 207.26]
MNQIRIRFRLFNAGSLGQSHEISAITAICSVREGTVQNTSPSPESIQNDETRPRHKIDTAQRSASLLQELKRISNIRSFKDLSDAKIVPIPIQRLNRNTSGRAGSRAENWRRTWMARTRGK